MTQLGDIRRNTTSAGFTAWLAVAAVLLLQVGAVAHEAHHSLSDVGDVCEVCVQFDGGTAADSSAAHAAALPTPAIDLGDWIDAPVVVHSYRTPRLRAPPATI